MSYKKCYNTKTFPKQVKCALCSMGEQSIKSRTKVVITVFPDL